MTEEQSKSESEEPKAPAIPINRDTTAGDPSSKPGDAS